jgi:hypothetical protein
VPIFDDILQSGGGRYNVQTGRRDGFVSLASNVDLPRPTLSVAESIAAFARKGLSDTDMVYLLGTINICLLLYVLLLKFMLNRAFETIGNLI